MRRFLVDLSPRPSPKRKAAHEEVDLKSEDAVKQYLRNEGIEFDTNCVEAERLAGEVGVASSDSVGGAMRARWIALRWATSEEKVRAVHVRTRMHVCTCMRNFCVSVMVSFH